MTLRAVDRAFGSRLVLDRFDATWEGPGLIGLLGPNGSGKTSLLRIVAQLLEADAGEVEVCSARVNDGGDVGARQAVGYAPHQPIGYSTRTVEQNLVYAARLGGLDRRAAAAAAARVIAEWTLEDVRDQRVGTLSRGWLQRYSFARADLFEPPVLLLDEPTTGLDADARRQLEGALARWRAERLVIVASHEREWLTSLADETCDLGARR